MMGGRLKGRFTPGVRPPEMRTGPARWFLFQGERLVISEADRTRVPLAVDARDLGFHLLREQYLGYLDQKDAPLHCYSGELAEGEALPPGYAALGLRRLFATLDETTLSLAMRAKQVVHWDRDHQFCGRCGTLTQPAADERVRICPTCGLTSYPRLSPAIIIAVTRECEDGERILLARNHRFRPGFYSVLAGFVEPGETLETCAEREVLEEVGIRIQDIRYFGSQPWPFPNSLMIAFTARYAGGDITPQEAEIAEADWFSIHDLPGIPPKISIARRMIDDFILRNGGDVAAGPDDLPIRDG